MIVKISCLSLAVLMFAGMANAEELQMPIGSATVGNRPIDIRGFYPGMSQGEVLSLFTTTFGEEPAQRTGRLSTSESGIFMQGEPFIEWMSQSQNDDGISVRMTNSYAGNVVAVVSRAKEYKVVDEQPIFAELVAALKQKYGEPSGVQDAYAGSRLTWMFKDGQQVVCDPDHSPQCLSPNDGAMMLEQTLQYADFSIQAEILKAEDDQRVSSFRIQSGDLNIHGTAEAIGEARMAGEVQAALAASRTNAVLPAL